MLEHLCLFRIIFAFGYVRRFLCGGCLLGRSSFPFEFRSFLGAKCLFASLRAVFVGLKQSSFQALDRSRTSFDNV